jgi:carbamoyltransferase
MIILGLNAFHADSSAALIRDGKLIAAAEEERFCRIKHWAGFPAQSIAYCLQEAGLRLADVDHIALNQNSRANLLRKISYVITTAPNLALVLDRFRNRLRRDSIPKLLAKAFPGDHFRGALHNVEHHLAEALDCFLRTQMDVLVLGNTFLDRKRLTA